MFALCSSLITNSTLFISKSVSTWTIHYTDILIIPNNNGWAQLSQMSCSPSFPNLLLLPSKKHVLRVAEQKGAVLLILRESLPQADLGVWSC